MSRQVIVLNSGGQDSALVLGLCRSNYDKVYSLSFNYGQRHVSELSAAEKIAEILHVDMHEEVDVSGSLYGKSPLVSAANELETYDSYEQMVRTVGDKIENTFVPMRNTLFIIIAANRAACLGAGFIATGVNFDDNANYPDCRQNYILALEKAINLSLGSDKYDDFNSITIETPLINLRKSEAIKLALNVPNVYRAWAYTQTAYDGSYPPSKNDHASLLRAQAFIEAGIPDPLIFRAWIEGKTSLPQTSNYDIVREQRVSSLDELIEAVGAK